MELDPKVVADICRELDDVEAVKGVRVLWAVESGSRAWGFPSPDSDYDCRFVYVRPRVDYLALFPHRDVIERTLDGLLDVNGWDLPKAIRLMLKGNAVIIEWLTSPLVYRGDPGFRDRFVALAAAVVDRNQVALHYLHLAYSMRGRVLSDGENVRLKKLFYVLRPAMALRWLRLHPGCAVAPMNFATLMSEASLDAGLVEDIEQLLALKRETRELGTGPLPKPIAAFFEREIAEAERAFARPGPLDPERIRLADRFFLDTLALPEAR